MNATDMKDEQKELVLLWKHDVYDVAKCLNCGCRTLVVQAHGHFEGGSREPIYDRITMGCRDCDALWTNRIDLGRRGG